MLRQILPIHKPKARAPFISQLAREFHRSPSHIWRVLADGRKSPLQRMLTRRQAQLIAAASKRLDIAAGAKPSTPEGGR